MNSVLPTISKLDFFTKNPAFRLKNQGLGWLMLGLFLITSQAANAQFTLITEGPAAGSCGTQIEVTVKASTGYNPLGTLQFGVVWDESKLSLSGAPVAAVIDGTAPMVSILHAGDGELSYTWIDGAGAFGYSMPNNELLLTLTFDVIGLAGVAAVDVAAAPLYPITVQASDAVTFLPIPVTINNLADISLSDTEPPAFSNCPIDFTVGNTVDQCGANVVFSTPVATDDCGTVTVTQGPGLVSGDLFPVGPTDVTFTADDGNGNMSVCMFTITVEDVQMPTAVCKDHTIYLNGMGAATIVPADIEGGSSDNCMGMLTFTASQTSFGCANVGNNNVTLTVSDGTNSSICVAEVTVVDDIAPTVDCPADIVVVNDPGECGAIVTYADPVVSDNCTISIAPGMAIFVYTGAVQTWVVPAGVTEITVDVYGADGHGALGLGGRVQATHPVVPGETLNLYVGGAGTETTGGFNGGGNAGSNNGYGGGGGASDIRQGGNTLNDRIIVAGGGGGTGSNCGLNTAEGGHGGGLTGGSGCVFSCSDCQYTGAGGSQVGGGLAGPTGHGSCGGNQNGALGVGGSNTLNGFGTGGGGGYYGGGSGCFEGAGGGSSYTSGMATAVTHTQGVRMGNGQISISYATQTLVLEEGLPSNSLFPVGTTENTISITDAAGNTASCSFNVTVTDNEDPTITCAGLTTAINTSAGGTGDCYGEYSWDIPNPSDNCGVINYSVTYTNPDGSVDGPSDALAFTPQNTAANGMPIATRNFDLGQTTVTYYVEDAAGNTTSCNFTVTVSDDEDPTFVNCPEGVTFTVGLFSGVCQGGAIWSIPVAADNCSATVSQSGGPLQGDDLVVGLYAIQYTAVDAAGNDALCNFSIEVVDTEDPVIVCPGNMVVDQTDPGVCTWTAPAGSLTPLLAVSNCPTTVTWSVTNPNGSTANGTNDVSGYTFALGTSTVTYTITETVSGQAWTCSFTVTVEDNEAPVIECPADIAVSNDPGECGAVVEFDDPTVSDNCGIAVGSGAVAFGYTGSEQTWTVPAGVTSITVNTLGAKGGDGASTLGGLGGQVTATIPVTPGEVLYLYVGGAGYMCDDISPAPCQNGGFNGGGNTNVYCNFPDNPQFAGTGGGASDIRQGGNGLGNRVVVAAGGGGGGYASFGSPSPGGNGGGLVGEDAPTWDGFVQGMGGTQVNGGAGAPNGGGDGSLGQGGNGEANCGGGGGGGGGYYGGGGGYVGGGGGGSSYTAPSASMIVNASGINNGDGQIIISYEAGSLVQVAGLPSGSVFPVGTTTNTFVITDASGNSASCSFEVTVTDEEDPTISCPGPVVINTSNLGTLGDCAGQYSWNHPGATDNCGVSDFDFTYSNPDGTIDGPFDGAQIGSGTIQSATSHNFEVGITTVTYYVEDIHGNTTSCNFTVAVTDDEDPTFVNCPEGTTFTVSLFSDDCTGGAIWSIPVAADNCSATVSQTNGPLQGAVLAVGLYAIQYTAEDAAGNDAVCNFSINVVDTEDPVIVCPGNVVVDQTDPGVCTWTAPAGSLTPLLAASNCPATVTWVVTNPDASTANGTNDVSGYTFELGTSTVTYTITETASAQAWTCSFTVTVEDNEAPTIECPADIVKVNDPGECGAVVTFNDPTFDDNCMTAGAGGAVAEIFGFTGAVQTWVVPAGVTSIHIDAAGAQGGGFTGGAGGKGAQMTGDFNVTPGQVLSIVVGQEGLLQVGGNDQNSSGGGGGTFVYDASNNLLIAAGGGGGKCNYNGSTPLHAGADGQITANGGASSDGNPGGVAGNGGNVGLWSGIPCAGGGTGWLSNGGGPYGGLGLATWLGGPGFCGGGGGGCGGVGGFGGGGGGGNHYGGGGGGGGYSGGGGGTDPTHGGGGGSFNAGINQINTPGLKTDDGLVVISYLGAGASGGLMQTSGLASGSLFPVGSTSNTFVVTDGNGNTAACSFTVTVTDEEVPQIECPDNVNITTSNLGTTGDCAGQYEWRHPLPQDNCGLAEYDFTYINPDGTIDGPFSGAQISPSAIPRRANHDFEVGLTRVTYYVTDIHGNTTTCRFRVTVTDDEDPTFVNCPEGVTFTVGLFSDDCQGGAIWSVPVAADNCSATVSQTDGPLQGAVLTVGTYPIQYTAEDAAGNDAVCNFSIEVVDTEDPVIVCPGNVVVDETDPGVCTWTAPAGSLTPLLAASNCPATVTWVVNNPGGSTANGTNDVSGYTFLLGTSTVTYTITETASGQAWTCSFTVTVEDNEAPTIECPADIVVANDLAICGAVVEFDDPTFSDNCTLIPVMGEESFSYSGSIETWIVPAGVTSITIEARGAEGGNNTISAFAPGTGAIISGEFAVTPGQQLKVLVGQKPQFGNGNGGGGGSFVADAMNNALIVAGGGGGSSNGDNPNKNGGLGEAGGNGIGGGGLGGVMGNGGGIGGGGFYQGGGGGGFFTDGAEGSFSGDFGRAFVNGGAGGLTFALGGFGGGGHGSNFNVGGAGGGYSGGGSGSNIGTTAGGGGGGSFNGGANAMAAVGNTGHGMVTIRWNSSTLSQTAGLPSGSEFPVGNTVNTFVITDDSGNTASCSFTVTVTDEEDPTLTCPPNAVIASSNLGTTGDCAGQFEWNHPSATDNCGLNNYAVQYTNPDNTLDGPYEVSPFDVILNATLVGDRHFEVGVSTVTYYAIDANGNTSTCAFTVTVTDDEDPTFVNCPEGVTFTVGLFSDDCQGGAIWSVPVAADNCSATVSQTGGPLQGEILTVGTYSIQYTATDNANNTATCNFTIEVIDTEDPVIVCPGNVVVDQTDPGVCTWTAPTGSLTPLLAASNCPATVTWEVTNPDASTANGTNDVSGYTFQLGISTVTYTITETASGQAWTCSFTVTVEDNEAPTIECPADIVVANDPEVCGAVVSFEDPIFDDNCTIATAMGQVEFQHTGDVQTWTVPAGVTEIFIDAYGAEGADGTFNGSPGTGAPGGRATGFLAVTPGQVLNIYVGGEGQSVTGVGNYGGGGYNGGGDAYGANNGIRGGGGGASDVRVGGTGLGNRVIVAGGGGGACCFGFAGEGGGLVGGNSMVMDLDATGGTQVAGGNAGCVVCCGNDPQMNGALGAGGYVPNTCINTLAGGGGGFYGGGSGNNAGGGSSYIAGLTGGATTSGVRLGNGLVQIIYNATGLQQIAGAASGSLFPVGTTVNTFVITDGSGNTASCSFTVTVTDEENPTVTCPQNAVIATSNLGTTGDCAGQYEWSHPSPSDNCGVNDFDFTYSNPDGTIEGPFDGVLISTGDISPAANRNFELGTTTVTYYVEDIHGNTTSCNFTVSVTDDEDPTFVNCPEGVTFTVGLFSDDCQGGTIWSIPVAADNCSATVSQTDGPLQGETLVVGTYSIQYTATDDANNTATCNFTIEVIDTEDPVIVCPGNVVIDETDPGVCTWTAPAGSLTPLLAVSNCPATIEWVVSNPDESTDSGANDVSGYTFELGTSTVTYTITETASGQEWTCSFTVTVEDNEAPVIECPADIAVSNDPEICGAVVEYEDPEVSDNCGLAVGSGAVAFGYTGSEQTWTVPAGVTSITVNTLGAKGGDGASTLGGLGGQVTATIPVTPGEVLYLYVGGAGYMCDDISPAPCQNGGFNGGGNTTVTCNELGNPQFAGTGGGASDIRQGGNGLGNRVVVAAGGGGGGFASFGSPSPGGDGGGLVGENAPTWEGFVQGMGGTQVNGGAGAPNGNGGPNAGDGILGQGGNGEASCGGGGGGGGGYYGGGGGWVGGGGGGSSYTAPSASMIVNASGINNGDGQIIISYEVGSLVQIAGLPSGSVFPVGTTTNTFVVTDASGNSASCNFEVTVTDEEDPTISCPGPVVITTSNLGTLGDCAGKYDWNHPNANDNCGIADLDFTYRNPDGTIDGPFDGYQIGTGTIQSAASHNFAVGTTTVTYYVEDIHGNTTSCNFTVTVTDDEDPAFVNCPTDIIVGNDVDKCGSNVVFSTPIAEDNCGATVTIVEPSLLSGSLFPVGVSVIVFHAEDEAGNATDCEFTITVMDMQTPTAVCQNITVDLDATGNVVIVPADVDGGSTDNCSDDLILTINESEFDCDEVGDNLVTLTVSDGTNTSICVATVTVRDVTPPTFTCPSSIIVPSCSTIVPDLIADILDEADNCGVLSTEQNPVAGLDFGAASGNSVDVTVTVTDVNGNVTTCVVTVTITDNNVPVFVNCPTSMIMIGNDPDQCSGKVNWQPPVALDDCLPIPFAAPGLPLPGTIVQTGGPLPGSVVAITCPPVPSTITYVATDASGNQSTCNFQIMVVDTQKPEFDADITMPNDTTVNCHQVPTNCVFHGNGICTPLTNNDVNDNCTPSAQLEVVYNQASTQDPNPAVCGHYDYDLTRTWTVTDCADNSLVHTQLIQVQDTTKPVAVCKNITITLNDFGTFTINPRDLDGGSTDNCAANANLTFTASQTVFTCADLPNSPVTVTLTVTDPCGNFSTCTALVTILEGNGDCTPEYDIDGSDPCACLNNATTLENGQFSELIQIHALAGQTWSIVSSTGLYLAASPAPPAAPFAVPNGTVMTNGLVDGVNNDGDGLTDEPDERVYYTFKGRHVDALGYSALIRSNTNLEIFLENKCYYPTPFFADFVLDDPLCLGTPAFTIAVGELNNAAGNIVPGSVMVNGLPTTVFDAGALGIGAHTVMATFDAGAAQSFTRINGIVVTGSEEAAENDPGCQQKITKIVNVVETPNVLICNDLVHVSMDADCHVATGVDDVLEGTYFCYDDYIVEVDKTAPFGNGPWVPAVFTPVDLGNTYQYRVTHIHNGINACWGNIKIEDKLIPALDCPENLTIACSESTGVQHTGNIVVADCSTFTTVIDDESSDFGQCSSPRGEIVRTWIVTDAWGNQAACSQTITIETFDLDNVIWPADAVVDCEVTYLNPAGIASINTGEPSINGASIVGSTWCGAQVGFNDTYFYGCGGTFTILREWAVLNNCVPLGPGNPVKYTQKIQVIDLGGPKFVCPPAVTVSSDPFTCCATAALPDMIVSEGCSDILDLEAKVTGVDPNNGNIITFTVPGFLTDFPGNNYWNADTLAVFNYTQCMPLGVYDVRYKASDHCGNTSFCSFKLTVADLVPPAVSCDQFTQVALTTDGEAIIPAGTFNDNTTDNCCMGDLEVARMNNNSCSGTDFGPSVKFCCSDIGDTILVVFRAFDCHGNSNDCMVSVLVEDKIKPTCSAPAPVAVNCENFDPSLWVYGFATSIDNCCIDTITTTTNYALFDTVCNKGTITRTFRALDCAGNFSTCTQRVVVTYLQDYYVKFPNDVIVTTCDGTGNYGDPIFFGEDCELLGVTFADDIFTVVPDACFKIERTWSIINWCTFNPNLPFIDVPNPTPNSISNHATNLPGPTVSACGTLPPWRSTVVKITPTDPLPGTDYCTFWDANANGYRYKQIIKITDGQAPTGTFVTPACDNQNWNTANNNALWNESYWWDNGLQIHDLCEEPTDLCITGTDACSGSNVNIEYLLFLDLDNNGTMETVVNSVNTGIAGLGWNNVQYDNASNPNFSGGTPRAFDGRPVPANQKYGFAIQETVVGTNKTACVRWNTQQQQNTYVTPELPNGTHKIKWFITDGCGNNKEYEYTFTVKDCKAPTVVCINGLSVNIMPTAMIQLWASDFLQYTEDNCTPAGQLKIGIRKCGTGTGFPIDAFGNPITNVTFTCAELGTQCVELWAIDAAGNADYCETYVIVQDNLGNCPTADKINVTGVLKTEMLEGVEEGMVNITGSSALVPSFSHFDLTDSTGVYAVTNAVPMSSTFTIAPEKDDNPLNGVTTYDLVLISKHILGLEPLNSPYKMIAADANKSGSITTFDIVEIRKLILGIYTELPNNTSWRFVDKAFSFPNVNNPFQTLFPETISVVDAVTSQWGEDFVGVKVGDVNSTVVANANMQAEERTSGTAIFDLEDRTVKAGETFEVNFKSAQQLKGFQFTMLLDGLEAIGVRESDQVNASNFGLVFADAATVSIDGAQEFTLQFRATQSGKLSEMLSVSGSITRAEAYDNEGRKNIAFRYNGKTISGVGFELYQNQPNPFVNKTSIGFFLPEASEATLSVYDESGRVVYQQKGQFAKGENLIALDRSLLNTNGVLYYELKTATDSATKKMIQAK